MNTPKMVLITGPMFAGKSDKLISLIEEDKQTDYLVFKPKLDTRSKNIVSRVGKVIQALEVDSFQEIYDEIINYGADLKSVFIDEAQFFKLNKFDFKKLFAYLEAHKINFYAAILNLDYLQNEFDIYSQIKPYFSQIIFLTAICHFTKRIAQYTVKLKNNIIQTEDDPLQIIQIENEDHVIEYKPVCELYIKKTT